MPRTYKVRRIRTGRNSGGTGFINYVLTIPRDVAEELPDDMSYECVILPAGAVAPEGGILFQPVGVDGPAPPKLPEWAQAKANGARKPRQRPGVAAK